MRYSKVSVRGIGYELAPNVVTSRALEARLQPVYERLGFPAGQLELLTGIRERRWWDEGFRLSEGAIRAGRKALDAAGLRPTDIGTLVYTGVCRENSEPATACAVADGLGIGGGALVYDVSNACLGVLNGMLDIANRIELGQIRAGMVVSCETAREINESMIRSMLERPDPEHFRLSIATLTGGSGAVGVVLSDSSLPGGHRLLGGAARAEARHHRLCRWDRDSMITDAAAVLKHGVELGRRTWEAFQESLGWSPAQVDKVICHQVGAGHRSQILGGLGVPEAKDFSTYEHLGNIGTVSLPLTAALASEREFLLPGDRVAFLGIGSGLNCMMLGLHW